MKKYIVNILLALAVLPYLAAATPTIRLICPETTSPGRDFIVTVRAVDFQSLRTYGIRVQYDTAALRCKAVVGNKYFRNYQTFYFTKIDSVYGNAGADESILGPGWIGGDGDLFSLTFVARRPGAYSFGFQSVKCYDSSTAQIVPVDTEVATLIVGVEGTAAPLPRGPGLKQNYPNPFSPERSPTTIGFTLATEGSAQIAVYDLAGRLVRRVASGEFTAGYHEVRWDGRDVDNRRVTAGVYLYRLRCGGDVRERMLVLR